MCTAATAKRRRKQANNNYRHLSPQDRPHYVKRDVGVSASRLQRLIEKQRAIAANKGRRK